MSLRTLNLPRAVRACALGIAGIVALAAAPGNAQEDAARETAGKLLPVIYGTLLLDGNCPLVISPATAVPDDEVTLCGDGFTAASSIEIAGQALGTRLVDDNTLAFTVEQALITSLIQRRLLTPTMPSAAFPVLVDGAAVGSITLDISSLVG